MPRSWHSSTSYFSFSATVLPQMSHTSPSTMFGRPQRGQQHLAIAVRVGNQHVAAAGAGLPQVVQSLQLAALALPVADGVLDELEGRVLAEIADRKHRLEHRLQPGVFALGRQTVHLQKTLV
jgi:hypothetical protein